MKDLIVAQGVAAASPQGGVRLAILNKRFESVVRKMANTLLRTGRSGVLNTGRDFSCCIVTADHELVTAAECYPIHVLRGLALRYEQQGAEFHQRVRGAYHELARREPRRFRLIDGNGTPEQIAEKVWTEVAGALSKRPVNARVS